MSGKFSSIEKPEPPFKCDPIPVELATDPVVEIDFDSIKSSTPSPDMLGLRLVPESSEPLVLKNMDIDLSLVPESSDSRISDADNNE